MHAQHTHGKPQVGVFVQKVVAGVLKKEPLNANFQMAALRHQRVCVCRKNQLQRKVVKLIHVHQIRLEL
jgi:hypothetical protein